MTGAAYSRKRRLMELICLLLALALLAAGSVLASDTWQPTRPLAFCCGHLATSIHCIDAMDLEVSFEPDEELIRVKADEGLA